MGITRRSFLGSLSLVGGGVASLGPKLAWARGPGQAGQGQGQAGQMQDPARTGIPGTATVPADLPTLREAGSQRGLLVGAAVDLRALHEDPGYAGLLQQQANIVVAENAMKFGPIEPVRDRFAFEEPDRLFAFAAENGMKVRGHNFVWHRQLPTWFAGEATKANAAAILTHHIEVVGARYAGRVHSWDVVNEAIQVSDGLPGGLRNSPWQQLLGPAYLDLAFRTARRVDPEALLCYNDYDLESESAADAAKRDAVLNLLRGLQARNVPIDAVGVQSHLKASGGANASGGAKASGGANAGSGAVYGPGLERFLREVQAMGLKVLLTEMDVNDRALPADIPTRDRAVAATYASYLKLALANPAVIALLTWGITDKYTWLNGEDSRADKQPERALPFDAQLRPKLAYVAEGRAVLGTRSGRG